MAGISEVWIESLLVEKATLLWLSRGDLKGENGSEVMAAHEQALQTGSHATKILQLETDSNWRL
jgi:hypothetical protein